MSKQELLGLYVWMGGWLVLTMVSLIATSVAHHQNRHDPNEWLSMGAIFGWSWPLVLTAGLFWFGVLRPCHRLIGRFVSAPMPEIPPEPEMLEALREVEQIAPSD